MSSLHSSLYKACSDNKLEDVKHLIGKGADVNWVNSEWYGYTPLMRAFEKRHYNIVRFLLTCEELDYDVVSSDGDTVLHRACCSDASEDILSYIAHRTSDSIINKLCAGYTPIMVAVREGIIAPVRVLGRIPRVKWSKEQLISLNRYLLILFFIFGNFSFFPNQHY